MRLALWIIGVLVTTGQVLAQEVQVKEVARANAGASMAIEWLIMSVFLVATLVVGFKPAKRSKLE
jgi:uncharacterized membrane protein YecN with MAPEG domain